MIITPRHTVMRPNNSLLKLPILSTLHPLIYLLLPDPLFLLLLATPAADIPVPTTARGNFLGVQTSVAISGDCVDWLWGQGV